MVLHGLVYRITRRRPAGRCFCHPILTVFKQLTGTPCSRVESTNVALDQREILKICSKESNICRCLKLSPHGLLQGTTVSKVTLQFSVETKTILFGTNTKAGKMPGEQCKSRWPRQQGHVVPGSVRVWSGKQKPRGAFQQRNPSGENAFGRWEVHEDTVTQR